MRPAARPNLSGADGQEEKSHLADLDGARRPGETGEASFERRHFGEGAATTDVDAGDTELVRRSRLQLHLPHLAVVRYGARVVLRVEVSVSTHGVATQRSLNKHWTYIGHGAVVGDVIMSNHHVGHLDDSNVIPLAVLRRRLHLDALLLHTHTHTRAR